MDDYSFIALYMATSSSLPCQDHFGLIGRLLLTSEESSSPCQLNGQTD
jgi:hypothetical protein